MANKNLKSIKFPGLSDTYVVPQIDSTLTQTGRPADAKATGDAISALGDGVDEEIDALKEDLSTLNTEGTVPTSEQMLSDNYTEDSVPYHFRKTASDNADREELEIVGGSVAWNQLMDLDNDSWNILNGAVSITATNGRIVANGASPIASTTSLLPFRIYNKIKGIKGHRYLLSVVGKTSFNISFCFYGSTTQHIGIGVLNGSVTKIFTCNVDASTDGEFVGIFAVGDTVTADFYAYFVDITAALGPTIADHIYALEQATAGAGVALFRSLFPKDYYAYDAGSMQSVSGLSEHRTVGFNVWDEEWELGYINGTTGQNASSNNCIRSKNYIPALGGTTYYVKAPSNVNAKFYDENKGFISGVTAYANAEVTTPSNTRYIRFFMQDAYGATYNHDICINLSDPAKNGTYEPYDGHSYALNPNGDLRGIPTLVDGKIKWDGDVYSPSGTVTRRFGIVDLGTLSWSYVSVSGSERFNSNSLASLIKRAASLYATINLIVSKGYKNVSVSNLFEEDKTITAYPDGYIAIRDTTYTDAAAFKSAMSGVMLVYELATPTTEQADPYVSPQICSPYGTEEFVSNGIVPVGHVTKYPDNLRMKLDNLPWNFASLIAPTESGFKATQNYTTGQLLIVNNVLYKATANIANGGTITPNTNVTATTLAEIIAALS